MAKKKSKSAKKAAAAAASRGVIGPDYIQVLAGTLASKSVSLVLCGESHHDAIDVTRAGGGKIKEGWMDTDAVELTGEMVGKFGGMGHDTDNADDDGGGGDGADDDDTSIRIKCGICKRNNKMLPFGKAKEWARDVGHDEIDYIDPGHEMVLLYVPSKDNGGTKGRTFLVELFLDESPVAEGEDKRSRSSHLPSDVADLLDDMTNAAKNMKGVKSLSKAVRDMKNGTIPGFTTEGMNNHTILSWTDMDSEARSINHRRILGEEISTLEYDELISERKKKRRAAENAWTWDDWLLEVKSKLSNDTAGNPSSLHVVLESSIPPWEVELCRDLMPGFENAQAAECIRCLSEDSEESEMDAFDAASDGFGSYMDYIYRRFLETERSNMQDDGSSAEGDASNRFLHCVDCRDLGCEHACVDDSLRKDWMDLLDSDEKEKLLGSGPDAAHAHHKDGRCLPDWSHSPEEAKLDELRSSGTLQKAGAEDLESDSDDQNKTDLITFPSLESFFGQCTDIMYYTPNCKVAYSPFLGKCVQSFETWNSFFAELFFGGTVNNALSMLKLPSNEQYLHIRSPIMKSWNVQTGEYEWHKRENEEMDLTMPILPVKSFLKARGSGPARTWSSDIFAKLLDGDCPVLKDMAIHTRQWVLDDIAKHCDNPKLSDDEIGGGEWFLAYLRQCHREIYDDIDHTDAALLLRKQYAAGETKKHKIGDITIPNCEEGFQLITDESLRLEDTSRKHALNKEAEVMAKILIDIYMSKLIDACTVAKIAQIISQESKKNITIVCYMGSVHTRALSDFFTHPNYGFKKKIFCGKQDWDEEEGRILHLPAELWNVDTLF